MKIKVFYQGGYEPYETPVFPVHTDGHAPDFRFRVLKTERHGIGHGSADGL